MYRVRSRSIGEEARNLKNGLLILLGAILIIFSVTNGVKLQTPNNVVWAKSGSAEDIQAAVDEVVAMGGGTVYIPEGNFTFNINFNEKIFGGYAGVVLPGGVNLTGMGPDKTILYCPLSGWRYDDSSRQCLILVDGSNEKPVRISGICFQGSVNFEEGADDDRPLKGLFICGAKDYRVDHCKFIDFCSAGITVTNNYVHKWNRGVIDHCEFDNPYKDTFLEKTGNKPYWAYGVIVGGDYEWRDMDYYLGKYDGLKDICYIEDCNFSKCRHAVAMGASCAWMVVRHCYFTEMIVSYFGSYIDAHGGARGFEAYNNIIENSPTDERSIDDPAYWGKYMGVGIGPRGGSGVIFNNILKNFHVSPAIKLSNDQHEEQYRLNGFWIWDNTFENVQKELETSPGDFPIEENQEYFLYAKPDYTPYPYPHPLTGVSSPEPPPEPPPSPPQNETSPNQTTPTPTPVLPIQPTTPNENEPLNVEEQTTLSILLFGAGSVLVYYGLRGRRREKAKKA